VISISTPLFFASVADLVGITIANVATKGYKALVSIIDVNRFRNTLVMFFIICNIAFYVVESVYFKELLLTYLANALKPFLVLAGNILKR
jgi:hypothetical protein